MYGTLTQLKRTYKMVPACLSEPARADIREMTIGFTELDKCSSRTTKGLILSLCCFTYLYHLLHNRAVTGSVTMGWAEPTRLLLTDE